ncbi:hypothetical protein HMPREF9151_00610 [Hoylesella saccharolytica F0055]|uniref:Uncharacterized protein n=1 Tax=Hoylesella saccharolytica F0055 TaxID=1127699 RepID=L1NHP8_9BACT|nr:hypothetical protein HMPREF9151_00610 [Hoylesella saccharolytica F0055]
MTGAVRGFLTPCFVKHHQWGYKRWSFTLQNIVFYIVKHSLLHCER